MAQKKKVVKVKKERKIVKRNRSREVTLPSGSVMEIRTPTFMELATTSALQNASLFEEIANQHISDVQDPTVPAEDAPQGMVKVSKEQAIGLETMFTELVVKCAVDPKVYPVPEPKRIATTEPNYLLGEDGEPLVKLDDEGREMTEEGDDGEEYYVLQVNELEPTKVVYEEVPGPRDDSKMYADEFDLQDQMFLFQELLGTIGEAVKGNGVPATFPQEQGAPGGDVHGDEAP